MAAFLRPRPSRPTRLRPCTHRPTRRTSSRWSTARCGTPCSRCSTTGPPRACAVAKVDIQDVYDEFSGGRVDPEALRTFLTYAYLNWNWGGQPPAYVLLVGDGHYDFKGALRPDLPNLIPPYLLDIDPYHRRDRGRQPLRQRGRGCRFPARHGDRPHSRQDARGRDRRGRQNPGVREVRACRRLAKARGLRGRQQR